MPRRHRGVLAIAFPVVLAACGSVQDDPTQPDGAVDPTGDAAPGTPDANPADANPTVPDAGGGGAPSVLSVTPPDGTAGVRANAVIVIAFSEPMDAASVAAAWASDELPASLVQLTWNASVDTLTVTPNDPLQYATGTGLDPSIVAPRAYAFAVAASATDASGVPLAAPLASGFTTAREMTVGLVKNGPLSVTMESDGDTLLEGGTTRAVGDTSGNLQYKTFASFALPALPAGAEVQAAVFESAQNGPTGSPYLLGDLRLVQVNTSTLNISAFTAAPLSTIGVLATASNEGAPTIDVTNAFLDDLAHAAARGNDTQYRMEFPTATDSDDVADNARFSRDGFALSVTYLVD